MYSALWFSSRYLRRMSSRCERRVSSNFALCSLWWSADFICFWSRRILTSMLHTGVSTTHGNLGDFILCSVNPLLSSCTPLSQYTSQVVCVCWKERLHGIVFDTTAIFLSEQASNCTAMLGLSRSYWTSLIGAHRVHGCQRHGLPVPFKTSSSRNRSTLDDGVHVVSVPDASDVVGEVVR